MADRIRHINTRNLVVCETFDDFAAAVNKTDFTVEDVVGYVTSLTNVYYWLNIESIWGAIGFTWTPSSLERLSREESILYPNPLYRLTQVTAEGENIPMDEEWLYEHRLSKGTGVFNRTTIPFSHIPKVPDGHRVKAITGATLANINPDIKTLYIDKSNWANLKNINDLSNRGITIYADLDGAKITSASNVVSYNGKLYLKADLSDLDNGTYLIRGGSKTIFATNDYYKELNIPIGEDTTKSIRLSVASNGRAVDFNNAGILKWEGSGPFELEHYFDIKNYNNVCLHNASDPGGNGRSGRIRIWSDNGTYHINNYKNDDNATRGLYPQFCDLRSAVDLNTTIDLTIDCTNGVSNVFVDYYLAHQDTGPTNSSYGDYKMLPIKYEGNVTSIGIYNPYIRVSENQWPEFNQNLVNKLNPVYGEYMFKRAVMTDSKCPYTIDMSNKTYFRVFYNATFNFTNTSFRTPIPNVPGQYYCDYYPKYTGMDHHFDVIDFRDSCNNTVNFGAKLPSGTFETDILRVYPGHYFPSDFKANITRLEQNGGSGGTYPRTVYADVSTPIFKLVPKQGMNVLFDMNRGNMNILGTWVDVGTVGNTLNIIELDDSISDSEWDEYLKAGTIMTFRNFDKPSVSHPAIASNAGHTEAAGGNAFAGDQWAHYTNFRLIYRSDIVLAYANYTNAELIAFAQSFRNTDNDIKYNIKLYYYIYERLANMQGHNYIADIVALGYSVEKFTPVE